jgi:hypothetical protein
MNRNEDFLKDVIRINIVEAALRRRADVVAAWLLANGFVDSHSWKSSDGDNMLMDP